MRCAPFSASLSLALLTAGFATSLTAHAQGAYGAMGGRTIYEESARQREHDQYLHQQSSYYSSTSNRSGSSSPSIPSWQVRIPVGTDYRKPFPDRYRAIEAAPVARMTKEQYFAQQSALAARGDARAADESAICLYYGDGTAVDKARAFEMFKTAGRTLPEAERTAAGLLFVGDGVPKDEPAAMMMMQHAAARGDAEARKWLTPVIDTPALIETEAAKGNFIPMTRYGHALLYGEEGYTKDPAKGLAYVQQAADKGNARAQTFAGFAYMFGDGTPERPEIAEKYFRQAYAQGEKVAAYQLAWLTAEGTPRNIAEARKWNDLATADTPGPDSIFQRASIEWSAGDKEKSRTMMLKAGEMGDSFALGKAALMEWKGDGGPADQASGLRHMEAAAKANDATAKYELANALKRGLYGTPVDVPRAINLMQQAAEQNIGNAQLNMAIYCMQGSAGVTLDYGKAAEWATKAAQHDQAGGYRLLAYLAEDGLGQPKNPALALEMMKKAAAGGDKDAKEEMAKGFTGTP